MTIFLLSLPVSLVEQGIESISLNPDAVLKTLVAIAAMEQHKTSVP